ncbi:hypothetical protein C8R44DRAFT_735235 [Mycena epipterygia]|nr:hypothetical protein C8R44DRAFT_735235 [Mycena epipterygia]
MSEPSRSSLSTSKFGPYSRSVYAVKLKAGNQLNSLGIHATGGNQLSPQRKSYGSASNTILLLLISDIDVERIISGWTAGRLREPAFLVTADQPSMWGQCAPNDRRNRQTERSGLIVGPTLEIRLSDPGFTHREGRSRLKAVFKTVHQSLLMWGI